MAEVKSVRDRRVEDRDEEAKKGKQEQTREYRKKDIKEEKESETNMDIETYRKREQ